MERAESNEIKFVKTSDSEVRFEVNRISKRSRNVTCKKVLIIQVFSDDKIAEIQSITKKLEVESCV